MFYDPNERTLSDQKLLKSDPFWASRAPSVIKFI